MHLTEIYVVLAVVAIAACLVFLGYFRSSGTPFVASRRAVHVSFISKPMGNGEMHALHLGAHRNLGLRDLSAAVTAVSLRRGIAAKSKSATCNGRI